MGSRNYFFIISEILLFAAIFFLVIVIIDDQKGFNGELSSQKVYTMYLGTNDKDTFKQEIPIETIREQMHEICLKYVDGYTVSVADGFYRDENGNITHEISLVYVFIDVPIDAIQKIMDEALIKFNQHSILLKMDRERGVFYSGQH